MKFISENKRLISVHGFCSSLSLEKRGNVYNSVFKTLVDR